MRRKTPLVLMEQAIMLLVFALAAVLCLRAFVWAEQRSAENSLRDEALLQAQNMAETLKHCKGDFAAAAQLCGGRWDGESWTLSLETEKEARLLAHVRDTGNPYLGSAEILLEDGAGQQLLLCAAWQEVTADA